jgi:yitL protein
MKLGVRQVLKVVRIKDFGAYLAGDDDEQAILLPKKELSKDVDIGSEIEVFVYRDSSDRLIATTRKTLIEVGEVARLKVKDISKIGAFVDIGLERDVLLPYKEMKKQLEKSEEILCALYIDRTQRLAATMKIYPYLKTTTDYKNDDEVNAYIYEIKDIGALAAVEDKFYGLIPKSEIYTKLQIGDTVNARILRVREDNKLDLSLRKKAYLQLEEDAKYLESELEKRNGRLGIGESASPETIKNEFKLSKKAFKRAIGHLLKERKIEILENNIVKVGERK